MTDFYTFINLVLKYYLGSQILKNETLEKNPTKILQEKYSDFYTQNIFEGFENNPRT